VFQALTDPRELAAWQADAVKGRVARGGTLELEWPRLGVSLALEVEDVVPEHRVVLAHAPARLELTLTNGGLELCHSAPFDDDSAAGTESSWRVALATLATYLGRHTDRARRVHWSIARAGGSPELCHAYFTDPELLSSWFGATDRAIGPVGSSVNITLGTGHRVRGPVIAHTPGRDLALRWRDADDSVLVFRTLPDPTSETKRHVLIGWSRWSELPAADEIGRELDAAAERLGRRLSGLFHA